MRLSEDGMLKLDQQLGQLAKERAALDDRIQRMELERDNLGVNLKDVMQELGGLTASRARPRAITSRCSAT